MINRIVLNAALAAAVTLSAIGAAEAMPIASSVASAPALDRSTPAVEKAAVVITRRRVVRPAVRVIRRRPAVIIR